MFSWEYITIFGINFPTIVLLFVLVWVIWEFIVRKLGYNQVLRKLQHDWLLLLGLVLSRLGYVAVHYEEYFRNPIEIIKISDGGFYPLIGMSVISLFIVIYHRGIQQKLLLSLTLVLLIFWIVIQVVKPENYSLARLNETELVSLNQKLELDRNPKMLAEILLSAQKMQKPVIINVWASWCPPCRREMPALERMQKNRNDVEIIFVNQQESIEQIQRFFIEEQLSIFNVYMDAQGIIMQNGNLLALPSTIFIDKNGIWRKTHTGEITSAVLNTLVDKLQ